MHEMVEVPTACTDPIETYYDSFIYRMGLTRGARYQAARRHQRRAIASVWAIISLSMYVFSISAYLAIYRNAPDQLQRALVLLNIVLSAFIIAFAVLESGKKHDLKAELFLRCAQGISNLRDKVALERRAGVCEIENIKFHVNQYNTIVHEFSDNHSETDYRTFRINIGKHDDRPFYSLWHKTKYHLDCWAIMLFAIIAPPIIVGGLAAWVSVT